MLTSLRRPPLPAPQDMLNLGAFMCPLDTTISNLPLLHLPERSTTGRLVAEALGIVDYDRVASLPDGMEQLAQQMHTARVELLASTCFQRVQEACQGGRTRAAPRTLLLVTAADDRLPSCC